MLSINIFIKTYYFMEEVSRICWRVLY